MNSQFPVSSLLLVYQYFFFRSGLVIVGHKQSAFDVAKASGTDLVTLTDLDGIKAVYPPAIHNGGLGSIIMPLATYSKVAGSATAAKAVELTMQAVKDLGGQVLAGKEACGTQRDAEGKLTGIEFKDTSVIEVDIAVLATGAWTASAFPELGLEKLIFASGWVLSV